MSQQIRMHPLVHFVIVQFSKKGRKYWLSALNGGFDCDLYLYKGPKISRDVLSIMAVSLNTRNSIMSQAYRIICPGIVHNTSYTQWVAAQ